MHNASNGRAFKPQLMAASVKLQRATESGLGFDPVSGFSVEEILNFLKELPQLGDNAQEAAVRATVRRVFSRM